MSTTLTLTANKSAAISRTSSNAATDFNDHTSATVDLSWNLSRVDTNYLLAGFPAVAASYDYKPILRAVVKAYLSCDTDYTMAATKKVWVEGVTTDWDEASVTSRKITFAPGSGFVSVPGGAAGVYQFSALSEESARYVLLHGCAIHSYSAQMWYLSVGTSRHSSPPQLLITFDDSNVQPKLTTPAPASGVRLNKASAIKFSTSFAQSDVFTIKSLTPASGTFKYRLKGASASTTAAAAISSTTISYTVPANTFSAAEYEYCFTVTDNLGQTASTAWSSFDTRDTISTATADEPSGTLCDGDQPINFLWTHINESGSPPTGAELQKSNDGNTWSTFLKRTTSVIGYKCPAGSFTSGTWFWRVRTYNLDNVAGAWSDAASFVVVAAPSTPKVIVKAAPRPLITWQTNEQSAFQIQLDTGIDTTDYGSGKSWRSPVYLDDGLHVVRVRVQNSYGIWSEWGSATFTVSHSTNVAKVTLVVDVDHRAELSWIYTGSWTNFVIYRDGVAIAKTTEFSYTDNYSVGTVSYQVRACASDGTYNYSLSNEVTVSVMPETVMLSALGSGEWLFLRLSTAQHRTNTIKASRTFSLTHLSGRKFPEAELTEFCDRSISVSYATDDETEKAALEALMGSPVCLKTPGGKMVIGILDTLSETESMFYSSYTFAVSQMHYQEEVDLDA